jgi:hypothetical protein
MASGIVATTVLSVINMASPDGGGAGAAGGATFWVTGGAVVKAGADEEGAGSTGLLKSFFMMLSMSWEASLACSSNFVDNKWRVPSGARRARKSLPP